MFEWLLAWKAQQGPGQAPGQRPRLRAREKVLPGCSQRQAIIPVLSSFFRHCHPYNGQILTIRAEGTDSGAAVSYQLHIIQTLKIAF